MVFNIAGTGAGYKSMKMLALQKALYQAGFLPEDAKDIYRVMEQAYKKIEANTDVSEFHVMGYSLGAAHAAFVAQLDQTRKTSNL